MHTARDVNHLCDELLILNDSLEAFHGVLINTKKFNARFFVRRTPFDEAAVGQQKGIFPVTPVTRVSDHPSPVGKLLILLNKVQHKSIV